MTKNAFEIRAEILGLAKDYLDKQVALNTEFTKAAISAGTANLDEALTALKNAPYSLDALMQTAEKLYTFVSKKTDK